MRIFRKAGDEKGQSIVEAAFVVPLLILLLCGILDYGWIFFNQLTVNNCSREGARYAAVNSDQSDLTSLVTAHILAISTFDSGGLTVAVHKQGQDIRVTVQKSVSVLTPLAGIFTQDQQVTLESASVMRIG